MKVMVFGTFDILHKGHLDFFRQARQIARQKVQVEKKGKRAKKHSNYLIVIVARDSTVKKLKKRSPCFSEKERLARLKKLNIVDKVRLGYKDDYFKVIEEEKPDIICLGYDQKVSEEKLRKVLKKRGLEIKIYRLKPYKPNIYKSSKICQNRKLSN